MDAAFWEQAWNWMRSQPHVVGAALVLLSIIVAKVGDIIFTRVVKQITSRTKTELDDTILNQLHRPVQLSIVLSGCLVAANLVIERDHLQNAVSNGFYSVLIALWTLVLVRISRTFFRSLIRRRRSDHALVQALPLLDNLVLVLLLAHGAYWLLDLWRINVTPLLASAGIVTAAVALASRDTLANFFGGVSIFVDRPYRLGDYIILSGGERGEVVDIGVRSTRILTRDDVLITVPNAAMANAMITNESGQVPRFRVRATVGVGYDSDLDLVEAELLASLTDIPEILPDPPPRVRFREFGDSALIYQLLAWIRHPADRGRVLHLINRNIHYRLRAAGIDIPYPQRVLTMAKRPPEELD